jgi:hypothetical protein
VRHLRSRSALLTALVLLTPLALVACGRSDGGGSNTPTTLVMMTDEQMDELQEKVRKAVEESPYGSTTVP